MEIRKSTVDDTEELAELFRAGRQIMRDNGNNSQWNGGYPQKEVILSDIEKGISYVCIDSGEIVGTCCFMPCPEPTYEKIYEGKWLNDEPYFVIHRVVSVKRGAGSFMLEHFLRQCANIRIDTHRDNIPMQRLLKSQGFEYCGIIYLKDGAERIAFQKVNG